MNVPPGKLLLAAAVLLGAALAQSAQPSTQHAAHSSDRSTSSAASVVPAAHGPLTVPVKPRAAAPPIRKKSQRTADSNQRTSEPETWNLPAGGKVLYLTFDDGPQRVYTPKVLNILAKHSAKATFFVLGREAAAHPDLVATTRRAGHRIGNHTWDHPMLTKLSPARLREEISSGISSRCFRPPFRDTNAHVAAVAAQYHQRQILWDVDTLDWEKPGAAKIERAILRGARPGAIILMHDGGGNRSQTVTALDRALTQLTAQGYTFQSLPC
ncbi:peptidoglycan/xylan/chitin deacetylase (PgdA/CDA1 family) [Kribbella amoyensis]|uniref:Peptidoglycan/xylan/chitin deacetylase (PgdA/CDA1 family) n=1 Tax=Kribbella amoyensis TaxID=996641 RepID=A0A561BU37_9ACTN|nr:polysaccharide deacetylase family protein [Kribbella amoyensis]TWD82369.1 peptidoglycan/xylan/chitin deacetylase (PgdA/CDA1 family) [Kribbella amoyensis]